MDINLYPDDVVVHKTREHTVGVVERTHYDLDSHTPHPGREETEKIDHDRQISGTAFKKFLKDGAPPKGTVLVRWQNNNQLALMPVSKLKLIDRSLLVGDCVKPTVKSALSGVVLNTFTTCSLQPMCDIEYQHSKTLKGLLSHDDFECPSNNSPFCIPPDVKPALIHDVPASELNITEALEPDDLVIYKDWLGRVDVLNIRIQIRLLDNCVVEISDEDAENPRDANAGQFYIGDIAKTKKGFVRTGKWYAVPSLHPVFFPDANST
jgi:ubiquitin-conjugating enzyme E2 O